MTLLENSNSVNLSELKVSQEKLFFAHDVYRGSRLVFVNCNLHKVIEELSIKVDIAR